MSRKPSKAELSFLMGWHGLLSGSFLVAYLTEDATYAMHVFSGVTVLLALGIRLLVGLAAPKGSPLALPSLSLPPSGGSPLSFQAIKRLINNWMAVGLLILITLAALSGCWSLTCATFKSRPISGRAGSMASMDSAISDIIKAIKGTNSPKDRAGLTCVFNGYFPFA